MNATLSAIANMPPAAADVLAIATIGLAVGALGLALSIWRERGDTPPQEPRQWRRRRNRDN